MGASGAWVPPPAYGRQLVGRRKRGERIGLLVVAVHDDRAGRDFAGRPGGARIAVSHDMLPHELDWSCAVALDCLIVGDCDLSLTYATATMLYAAGAASIWARFDNGIWRLARWLCKSHPSGFYAADGPILDNRLGVALAAYRSWALLRREGVYGTPVFDDARTAEFDQAFGHLSVPMKARLGEMLGRGVGIAA